MSSLWTPGGEHPVEPERARTDEEVVPPADPVLDDELAAALPEGVSIDDLSPEERARAEQMIKEMAEARQRLLEAPASTVVANHAMGLYELGALHLSQPTPDFQEASVAIDALAALVEGLSGRLDEAEPTLREALDQIRQAYVQVKASATPEG